MNNYVYRNPQTVRPKMSADSDGRGRGTALSKAFDLLPKPLTTKAAQSPQYYVTMFIVGRDDSTKDTLVKSQESSRTVQLVQYTEIYF